jgi:hypothetical protein
LGWISFSFFKVARVGIKLHHSQMKGSMIAEKCSKLISVPFGKSVFIEIE